MYEGKGGKLTFHIKTGDDLNENLNFEENFNIKITKQKKHTSLKWFFIVLAIMATITIITL